MQEARAILSLALAFLTAASAARATTIVGSWVPIFKGVDHSVSTNLPSGGEFPNHHVVHAMRVDLTDPDVRLFTTPRIANYTAGSREVGGLTVSDFLKTHRVQAAVNANFFDVRTYYVPAGTPMNLYGLAVSAGVVVSTQDERDYASCIVFDAQNRPTVVHTNWPPASTDGVYTAISGNYSLVVRGKNIISRNVRETEPRTAYGVSEDRRFLYVVTIDGRQPGYSDGSNDYETAGWLLLLGAYDGVNVDGGGSTTMVIEDSTGAPLRLNKSSAVADSGRERTVGSHFGIFAKPLPGFINDVLASPDETTAKITWTTVEPATTEVQYGVTAALGNTTGVQSALATNHAVQLAGLSPKTGYFFRVQSSVGTQQYASPNYFFVTTNYVTTNLVFGITNSWKFTTANPAGANWTGPAYDDSAWSGPGPGLLWVDVRPTGPNPAVEPKNTELPANPSNSGYPYTTYYFRSHFVLPNLAPGSSLDFSGYVDDGAVFYLNGAEVYRLRMPGNSSADTLASGFPCQGDATCPDEFSIPTDSLKTLVAGDNVLAVEVHNYNLRSADITFGLALNRIEPLDRAAPRLDIRSSSESITLSWDGVGFVLQSANSAAGPWTDLEAATESPVKLQALQSSQYYRLRK